MNMRSTLLAGLAATVAFAAPAVAQEQPDGFPQRPIEIVVVYPAGGGMDITARIVAEHAERITGHQFRVVNREGGGGRVGHTYMAREAQPDGYTIGVLSMGAQFSDIISDDSTFNADDFDPIAHIAFEPYVYMTRGESLEEMLDRAKEEGPGTVRIGTVPGSTSDLPMFVLEDAWDIEFAKVPFQGGAPRLVGLVNGTIDIAPMFVTEGEQYHETGDAAFVAVADQERHPSIPDVPTMPELGIDVPTGAFGATRYIELPQGVPDDIRNYLVDVFQQVLEDPETQEAFADVGVTVRYMGPEETQEVYDGVFETMVELYGQLQ